MIMFADRITDSMKVVIEETERRRAIQHAYNQAHGIVPKSTRAKITPLETERPTPGAKGKGAKGPSKQQLPVGVDTVRDEDLLPQELDERIKEIESQMRALAKDLRYEEAAKLRDRLRVLEARKLAFEGG